MAQPNLHILSQQLAEPVNQPMQTLVELGAAIASVHTKLAQQHEAALAENAQQHEAFLAELDHKHKAYLAKKAQQHEGFLTLQAQQYKKTRSIGHLLLRSDFTLPCRYIGLHRFSSFPFPTPKPMYDTILQLLLVRYDLADYPLYDINLGATHTTIPSTRGVQVPNNLVSSTTDSFR